MSEITKRQKNTVEKYQCCGCTCGSDTECFEKKPIGIGCERHSVGTFLSGVGKILLGLPVGFNRVSQDHELIIFENYETFQEKLGYDTFNVPIWKHLDENGNTLVRGVCPRINKLFIHVILGDNLDKIDCIEITEDLIKEMD